MTFSAETDIISVLKGQKPTQLKCRCRLAVWRQLPKLFPASSTLVTCSKKRNAPKRCDFLFRAVCSSRLSFLAQSADCFALGHRADEAYVRAHLAPKKRYQRFSLRAARPAPTKHTSTTLTCKVYGSVFCFLSPFFPVWLVVARNTIRNPIVFRAKIS